MNNDFRQRVMLPLLLPLAVIVGFIGVAFSLSRVFLAVPATTATFLALLAAAYVLLMGTLIVKRPRIPSRALSVVLVLGLIAVGAAGAVGAAAGIREIHPHDASPPPDEGSEPAPADDEAVEVDPDALVFVGADIAFREAPASAPSGEVMLALVNEDGIPHDVTIDELDIHVEASGGQTVQEPVTLEPGTYEYYCSVPGHRAAGMFGTLEVS